MDDDTQAPGSDVDDSKVEPGLHTTALVQWGVRFLGRTLLVATGVALVIAVLGSTSGEPLIVGVVAPLVWVVLVGVQMTAASPPLPEDAPRQLWG